MLDAHEVLNRIETATAAIAKPLHGFAYGMNGRLDRQMAMFPNLTGLRQLHTGLRSDVQSAVTVADALFKDAQNALSDAAAVPGGVTAARYGPVEYAALTEFSDMIQSGFASFAVSIARSFRERLIGGPAAVELIGRVQVRNGSHMRMTNFVDLTVRRAVLDYVNSSRIINMIASGATSAFIRHPDQGHEFNGVPVRLVEGGEGYSYSELQIAGAFHPQSKAIVVLS